jgi:hypothetical protein
LGAASTNVLLEVTSDGSTIRTVNRNELAKSYITMKRMEQQGLDDLVINYKAGNFLPAQVAGDDVFTGNTNLCPPTRRD